MEFKIGDKVRYLNKGYDYEICELFDDGKYGIKFANPFSYRGVTWRGKADKNGLKLIEQNKDK